MSTSNVIPVARPETDATYDQLLDTFKAMRASFNAAPAPTYAERVDRLERLHNAVLDYREKIADAMAADYTARSRSETDLMEILPTLEGIHYNRKHLRRWMKRSKRRAPLMFADVSAYVHYQPLGVVGIVVPWNFPTFLSLNPLAAAFAAGNRAMLKVSEFAPKTGDVLKELIETNFSDDEAMVITGGVEVASEFTKLPFDHLLFTGSTNIGRMVMRAAAENLTPVTLELGGKSPTIVHDSFPMEEAASRIAFAKALNAGQACVAPDYLLLPRKRVDEFIDAYRKVVSDSYPTMVANDDYSAIVSQRQHDRLSGILKDADEKGAELITINPAGESFEGSRKMPFVVLKNVDDSMRILNEEIFGPALPILPYDSLEEAIDYVNSRPRPLALYYFDWDKDRAKDIVARTHSGGVALNDVMTQVAVDDMPFGGVGPSGMGQYHGKEGFLTFSKAKGVVRKGRFNSTALVAPPWGNRFYNMIMAFQFWRLRKIKR